jgi:hypothetical protein
VSLPDYHYTLLECRQTCDYSQSQRVFCGGEPSVCDSALPCNPSSLLVGYMVCDT